MKLLREGYLWGRFFHMQLGYKICEDDQEFECLARAMRTINFKQKRSINQLLERIK